MASISVFIFLVLVSSFEERIRGAGRPSCMTGSPDPALATLRRSGKAWSREVIYRAYPQEQLNAGKQAVKLQKKSISGWGLGLDYAEEYPSPGGAYMSNDVKTEALPSAYLSGFHPEIGKSAKAVESATPYAVLLPQLQFASKREEDLLIPIRSRVPNHGGCSYVLLIRQSCEVCEFSEELSICSVRLYALQIRNQPWEMEDSQNSILCYSGSSSWGPHQSGWGPLPWSNTYEAQHVGAKDLLGSKGNEEASHLCISSLPSDTGEVILQPKV